MADELKESGGLKEVLASEILAKIEKGVDIDYSNKVIKGSLDLDGLNLKKDEEGKLLVTSQIRIRKSEIQGIVKFDNSIFEKLIDFEGSTLNNAGFRYAKFCKFVNFEEAMFTGYASFEHVQFMGEANFTNVQLSDEADAYFFEAEFRENAFFWSKNGKSIIFSGDACFQHAKFHKLSTFYKSKFLKKADFAFSRFNGEDAIFMNAQFEGNADFKGGRFKGEIDFWGAKFYKNLDLRETRFTHFVVNWDSIKNKLIYDGPVFLALIDSFKNRGRFEDADNCKFEYRTIRRKKELHGLEWILDIIAWLFYGYGVRFYYPLAWLIGIFAIFAFFYVLGGQAQFPNALGLSIVILTTTTQINGLNGPLTGTCWIMSIIERISGWLLMSTFLVALAKKTLR